MDYLAIADAIAARYAPAVVTPPAGLPNIAIATARPPNALVQSPAVIVWPERGEIVWEGGYRYDRTADFGVHFYLARHEGDIPRQGAELMAWLGVLTDQLRGAAKLGLPGVSKALVTGWQVGQLVYAGTTYDGITLTVSVWTEEKAELTP